ncbi:MAG: Lrp/AsnC ligand binding domain-containing protein, partial [Alphaproteobacteria bacterium]
WPEVRECHMIRGGGDFLLRLVARNTAHENELTARLTGAANVLYCAPRVAAGNPRRRGSCGIRAPPARMSPKPRTHPARSVFVIRGRRARRT